MVQLLRMFDQAVSLMSLGLEASKVSQKWDREKGDDVLFVYDLFFSPDSAHGVPQEDVAHGDLLLHFAHGLLTADLVLDLQEVQGTANGVQPKYFFFFVERWRE